MADLTWSNVTGIVAPELTSVALAAQTAILAYVNGTVDCDAIDADGEDGPTALLARAYLAAHIATTIGVGASGAGAVTSESIGGLSRSYAVAAAVGDDALKTTGYGVAYLGMINRSPVRGPWIL
jgi:hypothetical protein